MGNIFWKNDSKYIEVGYDLYTNSELNNRSWNDLDKTSLVISGAVEGISGGFGATVLKVGWQVEFNAEPGFAGSAAQDYFHGRSVNYGHAMISAGFGTLGSVTQ